MSSRIRAPGVLVALASLFALVSAGAEPRRVADPSSEAPPPPSASLTNDERALRTELDVLAARAEEAHRRLLLRGRALYRLARVGILPVGGGLGSLFEHAAKVERIRRALDQDLAESRSVSDRKVIVTRQLDELATQRAKRELQDEGLIRASAPLDDPQERIRISTRPVSASPADGMVAKVVDRGGIDAPADDAAVSFRTQKGRLPLPIAGRPEIRRVHRSGASGPGLELVSPPGTPVRAVFPGRVAFADRYDAFGSVVIVDHGDHFYTLMGDLASMDVRVGDDLSVGARIGSLGAASVLYFEIRKGASTIDPSPWLGL
jgi:hypothetical protein